MIPLTQFSAHPLLHALGWTLVHFCWQGALVAGMLWCILGLLGGRSSLARYSAACAAMLLMVALPLLTFGRTAIAEYQMRGAAHRAAAVFDMSLIVNAHPGDAAAPWAARIAPALDHAMPWLLAAWLLGALFFAVRLNLGLIAAHRMKHVGIEAATGDLQQRFDVLRQRLAISRAVRLVHSARVQVPTVIGWLRPVVLVPVSCLTGLSAAQIDAIFCHELAHIRRHDYLVSVFQSLAEALLFYHPAVWWVSRQLRRERECCCDELAVANCGDAISYARALSYLEERRAALPEFVLSANGGILTMRIKRLLRYKDDAGAPQFAALLLFALVATLAASSTSARVQAQKTAPPAMILAATQSGGSAAVQRQGHPHVEKSLPMAGSEPAIKPTDAMSYPASPARGASTSAVPPPPAQQIELAQSEPGPIVPGVVALQSGSPDMSCTFYDRGGGEPGTCGGGTGANPVYSCRANADASRIQQQASCEWKVKRSLVQAEALLVRSSVMQGNILTRIDPVYPAIARAAHVQGAVVLSATISKQGTVSNLSVISGSPMLIASAIDAVKQWVFKPYLLNGEPTDVQTTITVNFSLEDAGVPPPGGIVQSPPPSPRMPDGATPPRVLYSASPEYTEEARKAKLSGTVMLSLIVDEHGLPQNVHVLRGIGRGLDAKAVEAVEKYRFRPAMKDGKPVSEQLNIEVNFQIF